MYSQQLPCNNGPADHRMGICDRRLKCGTCRHGLMNCPGHFGAINLSFPIYHPGFLDVVIKILKSVCFFCSALLLKENEIIHLSGLRERKAKLTYAATQGRAKKTCLRCGGVTPIYSKVGQSIKCDFSKVAFEDPDEALYCQKPFTSGEARQILQNIAEEVCAQLGFRASMSRPENFVLVRLVVPPPIVRPSVIIAEGSKARGQDDLTSKLCDIVKANQLLRSILEKEAQSIQHVGLSLSAQQAVADLAFHVSTYMNNDLRGQRQSVQRSGLPSKSLTSRLKGKEGRIRGSLMGKRVNFSARSVVSPDAEMDIDQVGIPISVAFKLTIPEKVTDYNIDNLRQHVRLGTRDLRGAASVIGHNKEITLLEIADCERMAKYLKVGDTVERFLQDDDYVLFNRQPSLHKGSMMGYRVKVMPSKTFRLNLACTTSLNGDFDGDELNVHVPQDIGARVETQLIMAVPQQILSPQSNKPIIGLVQDSIIGAWLLSGPDTVLSRKEMYELRGLLRYGTREVPTGCQTFTGYDAFNLLLPVDMEYHNPKTGVIISAGCLVEGRLCKQTVGIASGSLTHHIWLLYSAELASRFLSDTQRLLNRWLIWRGFSIRLSDCEPCGTLVRQLTIMVDLAEEKVNAIAAHATPLQRRAGRVEESMSVIANRVLTHVGKYVHAGLDLQKNSLYQAVTCSSKGNLINMAQLLGLVGQQSVEGKRINTAEDAYDFGCKGWLASHGFVRASYFTGLSSSEFFFHTMAGREGLIDTSVKTASTGYLQRRLMKAMETLVIRYDHTVRNSRGTIVQFEYGGDNLDASYLIRYPLDVLMEPWSKLQSHFSSHRESEPFRMLRRRILAQRLTFLGEYDTVCYLPCTIDAAFKRVARSSGTPLSDSNILDALEQFLKKTESVLMEKKVVISAVLRWRLRVEIMRTLPAAAVIGVLELLLRQIRRSIISPGETVGALCAQSVSEPLTQLTLNTFHMAGVKEKNVTLGVPRIKELIDCTRHIKAPVMHLRMMPSFSNPEAAKVLAAHLAAFTLANAIQKLDILEEHDYFTSSYSELDNYLVSREQLLSPTAPEVYSPFVVRIRLDSYALVKRNLIPRDIAEQVANALGSVQVLSSEEIQPEWILRMRIIGTGPGYTAYEKNSIEERVFLRDVTEALVIRASKVVHLAGIPGIATASWSVLRQACLTPEGEPDVEDIYVAETEGSNLREAFMLKEICALQTTSNDVHDVLEVLGVEAASKLLFDQMKHTLQFDGNYINERHILLLVNLMTRQSSLMPISRHGINRLEDSGPLARASFEEVADQLLEAAAYGDNDPCTDFSSQICLGQRAAIGTGSCTVITNPEPDKRTEPDISTDDVVFTTVESDVEMINCQTIQAPIEMPFSDSAIGAYPLAIQHSFIQNFPAVKPYVPSSPKQSALTRKRYYAPSSPRGEKRSRSCE